MSALRPLFVTSRVVSTSTALGLRLAGCRCTQRSLSSYRPIRQHVDASPQSAEQVANPGESISHRSARIDNFEQKSRPTFPPSPPDSPRTMFSIWIDICCGIPSIPRKNFTPSRSSGIKQRQLVTRSHLVSYIWHARASTSSLATHTPLQKTSRRSLRSRVSTSFRFNKCAKPNWF